MIDLTRWEVTDRQRRTALRSLAVVAACSIAISPFAHATMRASLPLVAACFGAATAANAMTAFLLASQYRTTYAPEAAVLAVAYGVEAAMMTIYLVSYLGVYPGSVSTYFGRTPAGWIYMLGHGAFLLLLLGYVATRKGRRIFGGGLRKLAFAALFAVAAVGALPFVVTLPDTYGLNGERTPAFAAMVFFILVLGIVALTLLVLTTKLRSMLDVWLAVTISAVIFDVYLMMMGSGRFSVGWYASRFIHAAAALTVLAILVYQIDRMYGELARTASRLRKQAHIDGLTGIPNRRRFTTYAGKVFAAAQRRQAPLSVLLCDIDRFKAYNDAFGHLAGDDCLRHVAHLIQAQVPRPGDLTARYGGEEFVCLLLDTDLAGARIVAERIRLGVERACIRHAPEAGIPYVTISIGCCELRSGEDSLDAILGAADAALYRAKAEGRNRVAVAAVPALAG